jgi:hypothetical protein
MANNSMIHSRFGGRVEIPRVKNFVEEVAKSLKIDLSPADLTHVKWLAWKASEWAKNCEFEDCWRDNDLYTENYRKKITRFIKLVASSRAEKDDIPKRFRDYHEFGIDIDSD